MRAVHVDKAVATSKVSEVEFLISFLDTNTLYIILV